MFADAGFDVWLGNVRGNVYSRRHTTLNPDTDTRYWEFSFDHYARHDMPSMLDYIIAATGCVKYLRWYCILMCDLLIWVIWLTLDLEWLYFYFYQTSISRAELENNIFNDWIGMRRCSTWVIRKAQQWLSRPSLGTLRPMRRWNTLQRSPQSRGSDTQLTSGFKPWRHMHTFFWCAIKYRINLSSTLLNVLITSLSTIAIIYSLFANFNIPTFNYQLQAIAKFLSSFNVTIIFLNAQTHII